MESSEDWFAAQPMIHVPEMEAVPVKQMAEQSGIEHNTDEGRPEVYHGTFSDCVCKGCMEDAKREVEKRFSNETLTTAYIKKLQFLVNKLQLDLERNENSSFFEQPHSPLLDPYSRPRMLPPPPPPPGFILPNTDFKDPINNSLKEKDGLQLTIVRKKIIITQHNVEQIHPDHGSIEPGKALAKDVKDKNVLTVFRIFDKKGNLWRRSVEISSPQFIEVLRESSEYDNNIASNEHTLHLMEPLKLLFHHRKQLTQYLQDNNTSYKDQITKQSMDHTKLILDYMRDEFEDVTQKLNDLESAQPSGLIDFPDIWLLYPPGTVVYSKYNGEYEAYIVDSLQGVSKRPQNRFGKYPYSRLDLICWSINYDGEVFGRQWTTHIIAPFSGSKEISSLDLVPEKFLPNARTIEENLIVRGRSFWYLQGQNYREYTGEIWSQQMSEDPIRVMVDHLTYQRRMDWPIVINKKNGPSGALNKNWKDNRFQSSQDYKFKEPKYSPRGRKLTKAVPPPRMNSPSNYSLDREFEDERHREPYSLYPADRPPLRDDFKFNKYDALEPDSTPDDLTLLLCPQHVHGYCLKDRTWKTLNVTQLRPVMFRKNAWVRLVLDEQYKDIVKAMVSSYVGNSVKLDDLVAGKGAGLVALLHGPPGTGKTLTAECVAESFERPLYQVTCGDIGTNPERVEERLAEIFDYSVTWGAILLLDEADIFLQDREYDDLQRNALVSIFLRTLEYFNGILFLTTNRVGTFDDAFQSRIHVTLGLPQLDQPRRANVWRIFLHDLRAKGRIPPETCARLEALVARKWSREPLNGRQIRNAVRTALVVAENKREGLAEAHFDVVLRIGREFQGYMSALQDGDEAAVADRRGTRLADLGGFQEVERP